MLTHPVDGLDDLEVGGENDNEGQNEAEKVDVGDERHLNHCMISRSAGYRLELNRIFSPKTVSSEFVVRIFCAKVLIFWQLRQI